MSASLQKYQWNKWGSSAGFVMDRVPIGINSCNPYL